TRWAGFGWIAAVLLFYVVYLRRFVEQPLTATVKAPPAYGPALALEYRRLLVPVLPGRASDEALDIAAGLAAERGAQITAVYVVEVPLDQPLAAELPAEEEVANRELDEARAIGESYGVTVIPRLVRARNAGKAIVREADRRATEIIVIGAPRKDLSQRKQAIFGRTVDIVLKNASCRVLVTAVRDEAA
ncbi:MAG TPA: universal stress protein, partial [Gaiella sp.]|nr:universal stress protein [Gaiella sp.]